MAQQGAVLPAVHALQFENDEDEDEYFENTDDALYDLPIGGEDTAAIMWAVGCCVWHAAGCGSDAASILQHDDVSVLQPFNCSL